MIEKRAYMEKEFYWYQKNSWIWILSLVLLFFLSISFFMDGDISGRIGVGSVVYPESSSECYLKAQAEWKECYQIVDIDYFSCTASNGPDCGTKRMAGFDACDKTYKEASTLCCQTRCNEYKAVCYISAKRNYDACKNSYSTSIYNFFVGGNYCLDKYEIDQKNCDKAITDCNTKCAQ